MGATRESELDDRREGVLWDRLHLSGGKGGARGFSAKFFAAGAANREALRLDRICLHDREFARLYSRNRKLYDLEEVWARGAERGDIIVTVAKRRLRLENLFTFLSAEYGELGRVDIRHLR